MIADSRPAMDISEVDGKDSTYFFPHKYVLRNIIVGDGLLEGFPPTVT